MPAEPAPGPGADQEPLPRDASSPGAPGHSPSAPGHSPGRPGQEDGPGHLPHPGDATRPGDDPALGGDRAQDDILDEIIAGSDDEARRLEKGDEEDWDGEDPDSSCPHAYIGVPLREILAVAGTPEAEQAPAAPEAWEAGFLPRSIPAAHPSPGPAGGFASGGALDAAPPDPVLAAFAEEVTGPDGRCMGASDDELIGVLRAWQARSASRSTRRGRRRRICSRTRRHACSSSTWPSLTGTWNSAATPRSRQTMTTPSRTRSGRSTRRISASTTCQASHGSR